MSIRRALLAIIALLASVSAEASYLFTHFDMSSGLSQNSVLAIVQDDMGFMWFGTKDGLNRYDGETFKVYRRGENDHGLDCDYINCLYHDPESNIWIGTDRGVFIYTPSTDSFKRFTLESNSGESIVNNITLIQGHDDEIYFNSQRQGLFRFNIKTRKLEHFPVTSFPDITSLAVASDGKVWIGLFGSGLHYTDNQFSNINPYLDENGKEVFRNRTVSGIIPTEQERLFVCTDLDGLSEINTKTHSVATIMPETGKGVYGHNIIRNGNEIWMATEDGLYVFEMLTHNLQHYRYEPSNPFSLSDNSLQCVYRDREGGMWVGSYFGGVNYSQHQPYVLNKFFPRNDIANSLSGRRVREFAEDGNGNVWIGTEDHGLNMFDPHDQTFHFFTPSLAFPNIHGLCLVDKDLWIGTFSYGLKIVDTATRKIVRSYMADGKPGSLPDNNIFTICKDSDKVYLGQLSGLTVYDRSTRQFTSDATISGKIVYDILEDRRGNLWVAQYGKGLFFQKKGDTSWRLYASSDSICTIPSNNVLSLYEDTMGHIWVTTEGSGVARYDQKSDCFEPIPVTTHKPIRTVYQIVEDTKGLLWMSTNEGLVCYNPQTTSTHLYTTANGLLDNNFNYSSSLHASDGTIYMGSLSGFVAFSPESFGDVASMPTIVATELLINNVVVDNFSKNSPLEESISFTKKIVLSHSQNSFSLRVVMLSFNEGMSTPLEYMLEGFDNRWQSLYDENNIKYTNLPSGTYQLKIRVQGRPDELAESDYCLEVVVRHAPWATWWARLIYLALLGLAGWLFYRYFNQRSSIRRRLVMEKFEHEKEQELYQSKINFFTNVAHEIRTPLSLIKGPLDDVLTHRKNHDDDEYADLDIMRQNVDRLLDLTNQLLDFRRTERNGLKLNLEECNISKVLESVYVRFTTTMRGRGIQGSLSLPEQPSVAFVDKECLTKILSNLINNAVKYCDKTVSVALHSEDNGFTVQCVNDGKVVPSELREKLFTPFFRMADAQFDEENGRKETASMAETTGTGIGLALARTLAELHGGTLEMVDSDRLNIFKLTMPQAQSPTIVLKKTDDIMPLEEDSEDYSLHNLPETDGEKRHTVLIVEDNAQMQQYEKRVIGRVYNVLTANNGEEALQVLSDNEVDIIVSDAMMEPMGGFELCERVKNDLNYSHIPFVLLTALTLDSAKVKGMESGADSYIEKPFSVEYLFSVIQNLVHQRETIKQAYASSPFTESDTVTTNKSDEAFIKRLQEVVEANLSDSSFDINKLASEMAMSRTKLNRKLRGTFNLTPNNYIRIERLKRAAKLLKQGDYKVTEVSYIVGFNSSSYFSQCFYKQFGLLPKDFLN
ncbi:MAG: response regulator [Prevotella sp.]|nr:response regulator [Prevotella sp.]